MHVFHFTVVLAVLLSQIAILLPVFFANLSANLPIILPEVAILLPVFPANLSANLPIILPEVAIFLSHLSFDISVLPSDVAIFDLFFLLDCLFGFLILLVEEIGELVLGVFLLFKLLLLSLLCLFDLLLL